MIRAEGSSPETVIGEGAGHHRGLRAGRVFRGVTQELGRANCLLEKKAEKVEAADEPPGVGKELLIANELKYRTQKQRSY